MKHSECIFLKFSMLAANSSDVQKTRHRPKVDLFRENNVYSFTAMKKFVNFDNDKKKRLLNVYVLLALRRLALETACPL